MLVYLLLRWLSWISKHGCRSRFFCWCVEKHVLSLGVEGHCIKRCGHRTYRRRRGGRLPYASERCAHMPCRGKPGVMSTSVVGFMRWRSDGLSFSGGMILAEIV